MKTALITGITSQDGAYLAQLLLNKNYKVIGIVRKSSNNTFDYLKQLKIDNFIEFDFTNLLDNNELNLLFKKNQFDEIYNLAAQSSVSKSFIEPLETIKFNSLSTLNLLELIRIYNQDIKFLQPSSSEMYGKAIKLPINENSEICPTSPYAVSKAMNFLLVNNYREVYNLFVSNVILFNHESIFRTNNFFLKKVISSAVLIKKNILKELRLGNIDIYRDFGFAPEYVKAMWLILNHDKPDNFVVSSGKSILLRDIVEYVFHKLDIDKNKIIIDPELYRPVEIEEIYGDNSKIKNTLNWKYDVNFFEVVDILIDFELNKL